MTTYTYDAAGRQTGIAYANGATATYGYDNADRLLSLSHSHPTQGAIASFTYTLDAVGNRRTMVDGDGTTTYTYDALNRLTRVVYPGGETVDYTYDPMGSRLTLTSSVSGAISYTYDAADQLLTAGATTYTWDANGNMTGKGGATYTWDALDRLTGITNGATTAGYSYNGDGARTATQVNGVMTQVVQDVAAPLPLVLAETAAGQTSRYIYGNDLLTQLDPAGAAAFYHPDGLGSTRALSNSAGQRTDWYSYDAFGATRSHTGPSGQAFTFTGEQVDGESGLVFLRARYYEVGTGRFISRDAFGGFDSETQTLNRYVYAQNRPVTYVDPDGRFAFLAVAAGAVIVYGAYETYQAWNNFIDDTEQAQENLSGYYEFDFDDPEWQSKYEDYNPGKDIHGMARSGLYAGLSTPGTSLSGPPATSLDWAEPVSFFLKKLLGLEYGKPARVEPVRPGSGKGISTSSAYWRANAGAMGQPASAPKYYSGGGGAW